MNNKNNQNLSGVLDHLENALEGREECNIDNWQINIKAAALAFNKIDLGSLGKGQDLGNEIGQQLQAALRECEKYAHEAPASDPRALEDYHEVLNTIDGHIQTAVEKTRALRALGLAEEKSSTGPTR